MSIRWIWTSFIAIVPQRSPKNSKYERLFGLIICIVEAHPTARGNVSVPAIDYHELFSYFYYISTQFYSFSRFDVCFREETVKRVIQGLTELVENEISKLLSQIKCAVMYDGWTRNGKHYVGIFGSFMKKVSVMVCG